MKKIIKKYLWHKVEDKSIMSPWYLGLSYYDIVRNNIYLTIMPFNLIIRGIVKLYKWIKFG